MATTREQVRAILEDFVKEYDGKYTIWGIAVGAGPGEYDEYGKPRHRNKNDYTDWSLHVFIDRESERDNVPSAFRGVPLMVFVTDQSDKDNLPVEDHTWSQSDVQGNNK